MKIFILFISCFILCSCARKQADHQDKETPKALEDKKSISLISKRGSGDLVESLYDELVSEKPELKELEDEIEDLDNRKPDSMESFENYNAKSNNYYSSANRHIEQIKDSVLKERMKTMMHNSQSDYNGRVAALAELVDQVNNKGITLNDYHLILKLSKTLMMIESFQKKNLPSTKPIAAIAGEYNKLIHKTNSFVEK